MIDPLLGVTVSGRYEIIERLGEGGMGSVYKARQEPIGRLVALKVLLPEVMNDERTVNRFLNEARIISQLRHHNTVKLIDFGHLEDGRLFIAMEYLDGGDLSDLMLGQRVGQVPALRIAQQICKALGEAHALGIVHRDLKPENVLLDEMHGEVIHVRVVDFGLAKVPMEGVPRRGLEMQPFGRMVETVPGVRLGTPAYMSPEQAFARPVDGRSDLYSLGVLLYKMLTGHVPFAENNTTGLVLAHLHDKPRDMREMAPDAVFDDEVVALVMSLMEKKAELRPQNTDVVSKTLERLIERLNPVDGPATQTFTVNAAPRPVDVTPESVDISFGRKPVWPWVAVAFMVGGLLGWVAALIALR